MEIPPPEDLSSQVGPAKKKRTKAKSKAESKFAARTPDSPVVVEEEVDEEVFSEFMETIFEVDPIQQRMPGIKIRELEIVTPAPSVVVPSFSDKKGKRVLEEESEVYTTNIRAHKPDVPFVNLNQADMVAHFNKAA